MDKVVRTGQKVKNSEVLQNVDNKYIIKHVSALYFSLSFSSSGKLTDILNIHHS